MKGESRWARIDRKPRIDKVMGRIQGAWGRKGSVKALEGEW